MKHFSIPAMDLDASASSLRNARLLAMNAIDDLDGKGKSDAIAEKSRAKDEEVLPKEEDDGENRKAKGVKKAGGQIIMDRLFQTPSSTVDSPIATEANLGRSKMDSNEYCVTKSVDFDDLKKACESRSILDVRFTKKVISSWDWFIF